MKWFRNISMLLLVFTLVGAGCSSGNTQSSDSDSIELLNVSYDPTRELYQEYNQAFQTYWKQKSGQNVTIKQSHGGSGKQGRSIIDGLEADVATLALAYDIDSIAAQGLLSKNWQEELPDNSTPYTSTIVFLVKKGNPKQIKDWDDLVKDGVSVITPNPKTSGGARWNYLAAWAYADKAYKGNQKQIESYMKDLYGHVEVLDSGARGATTTFVERGLGDVLIAWENEAYLTLNELGKDKFEIVYPSISILAEPPVAVVDKVAERKGTEKAAKAYLEYLYSEKGQEIAAKHYYRPRDQKVLQKFQKQFPRVEMANVNDAFGGWKKAQEKHFNDGGIFDQLYRK
ncbi:sulfate ABC transporter substrate-binding protein [Bacillus sonorensis]|uniref:Sulfate-binding protein n=2 Tax=Bacillus sonorensis TaxID=119858 RepID=A0ABN5AGZ3_9BACI|nr:MULTISPECIES: sulfate ABC transporter substrate-binding protein [Bacillus]TWK72995.1 Sulfate-binding protein [Bacillus paralicheniformis]ASB89995.1 Sulfate-binding protein [Bacillus sonorensis]MBG9916792.1 sulfate transporter subunit [Bacillus sonorensis]MCF7619244.1 sulfate ABC transporter substrate-binding protein [Bacillus sonorensis]MCY7855607.1 sulfate ABC transporter substrate-binding protein [Bacillus sonorensis]